MEASRERPELAWFASLLLALLPLTACGSENRISSDIANARRSMEKGEGQKVEAKNAPLKRAGVTPDRLVIDAIGVSAPVIRLGLNPDGTLEVPQDYSLTGWWIGGAKPGEPGPAVIVGHIDSKTGPAVFHRLRELEPGQTVQVIGGSGRIVKFEIRRLEQHSKDAFPTKEVYGDTRRPSLRLITCGGEFDHSSGHYVDNVIVFASLEKR